MVLGLARLAGPAFGAFKSGLTGATVAANAARSLKAANAVGRAMESPLGNYVMNTTADAGLGMLWGENPLSAIQRSAIGNLGGTAGQKLGGMAMSKMGIDRGAQELIGGAIINPLAYTATEMAAMKIAPGLYGLDKDGNYVGDGGRPEALPTDQGGAEMMASIPGLTPLDRRAAEIDFYFDQQDQARKREEALAKEAYRRSLESQYSGFPPGLAGDQSRIYGGSTW